MADSGAASSGSGRADTGVHQAATGGSVTVGSGQAGNRDSGQSSDAGVPSHGSTDAGLMQADASSPVQDGGPRVGDGQPRVCPGMTDPYADSPICSETQDCTRGGAGCVFTQGPGGAGPQPCNYSAGAPPCASGRCAPGDPFADARGCVPMLCIAGATSICGPVSDCKPDAAMREGNGCLRKPCAKSEDCPCGTCVHSQCYERPFHCLPALTH